MKILGIKIKNLASLEGENEIDFTTEPLKSAGIFAITGPMGAGKSTLLDALCIALFAKTPRHVNARETGIELVDVGDNTISQGDIRSILSKGCTNGYAEVKFAGTDGNDHQAKWSVRRAHNTIEGGLQTDTIELTNITTNTVYPDRRKTEVLKEIERLVGLNFEQFTRSVLLAQGEFTAFLKANKDQKSSLLEKLTGTDIYSAISIEIFAKYREAEQIYRDLKIKMEGIELLSEAEIQELTEQKISITAQLILLDQETAQLVDDINWHKTLQALSEKKSAAETTLVSFKMIKEEAKNRISLFNQVEKVQDAREIFSIKNGLKTLVENTKEAIKILQQSIEDLDFNHSKSSLELINSAAILAQSELAYEEALPQLSAAKVLDTLIKEKVEQAKLSDIETAEAKNNKALHLLQITEKTAAITNISEKIYHLKKWKQHHEARKPIAENLTLIVSKLTDAGIELKQEQLLVAGIANHQKNLLKINNSFEVLKNQLDKKNQALNKLTLENEETNLNISAIKITEIKTSESLLIKAIDDIVPATSCWEILYTNEQEYTITIEKIKVNQQATIEKKENLAAQNTNLLYAEIKQGEAEKILNQALLQTQQNVEAMRAMLIEGDPCPVCGNEHHPFSTSNPMLDKVMDTLKKEAASCKEKQHTLWVECNKLTNEIEQLGTRLIDFEQDKTVRAIKIEELTVRWQSYKMPEACQLIAAAERLDWLKSEEKKLRQNLILMQQQVTKFELLKQSAAEQKENMLLCEREAGIAKEKLNDFVRQAENLTKDIQQQTDVLAICKQKMATLTDQLTVYFSDKDWCSNWQINAEIFVEKVNLFSTEWNQTINTLETDSAILQTLNTELNGLQQQLVSITTIMHAAITKNTGLQQMLITQQKERKALFNGESINITEQHFKDKIEAGKKNVKEQTAKKEVFHTGLLTANGQLAQQETTLETLNIKIEVATLNVTKWIAAYNEYNPALNEATLVELLAYPNQWITEERQFINQSEQAIIKANATFDERNLQLLAHTTHKTPKQDSEELALRLAAVKQTTETFQTEGTTASLKLSEQQKNIIKIAGLIKIIESNKIIYENWSNLNDLIGSADGKKFRQFAQEYTLDILLGFSNAHLQDLAQRYTLERVPGTLALQVIDKDMGDEIRSVHSLSGGESFLVSLALALGLSSLSSNKMKVESLFIDEGFGSLDPATLLIAMDALGKLQGLGRKVGVISHVAEMTENITTQIRISKVSNGRSKVMVV